MPHSLTVLKPHSKDLGGLQVRRLLPASQRKMVGPFIFFDHMGPARFAPGDGVAVRPHPHIGLATVTYLFEGALVHRDSLGTVQRIEPGDVNWMTAGSGIVHSERTAPEDRAAGSSLHGIQTWLALPLGSERTAPGFSHHPRATVPIVSGEGFVLHVIAGQAFGARSPVSTYSEVLYVAGELAPGARVAVRPEHDERAVYVVAGEVRVGDTVLPPLSLGVLPEGAEVVVEAVGTARVMLLGGAAPDGDRHIWWNFVASTRAAIEEAKTRWREGRFPAVPDETEFIPLPDA